MTIDARLIETGDEGPGMGIQVGRRRDEAWAAEEMGFTLAVVLFVLVILSALAVATILTSRYDAMAGRAILEYTKVYHATQAGANAVIAGWDEAAYDTLLAAPGDSLDLGWQTLENGVSYRAVIRRVDDGRQRLYALTVTGRSTNQAPHQQRTVGLLMRRVPGSIGTLSSALMTGIGLRKNSPEGGISGYDQATPADCPYATQDTLSGVMVPSGGLQFSGSDPVFYGEPTTLWNGTPQSIVETSDALAALQATGIDWNAMLNGSYDYVVTQKSPGSQWPDFSSLPPDAFPSIIVTASRVDLNSAYNGRGLLVVTEELRINNDFSWDGIILVGNFMQSNGKMTIRGAVLTGLDLLLGRDPATMNISAIGPGLAQISYNSCFVGAASESIVPARAEPIGQGAWSHVMN